MLYYALLIIAIIAVIFVYYAPKKCSKSCSKKSSAIIVYSDGTIAELPPGKYYIKQELIFSSKKIYCLPYNAVDIHMLGSIVDAKRHLTNYETRIGELPRRRYQKYFIEV